MTQHLGENVLVDILRRNLLPEIQHEMLNIQLVSVAQLRDICRRREFFLQDINKRQHAAKQFVPRKQIHEIMEDNVETFDEDVSEISLLCWNCQKSGHRYQDCLEERKVFCYGCGTPNIYKPKCAKCTSKNFRASAPRSAHKQTNSTSTNTE